MNWVDLLIAGVLAWMTFRAFSNGLIREAISLLSLVAGLMLSGLFYDNLSTNLEFLVPDPNTRRLATFAAIFVGTAVAGQVIGMFLRSVAAVLMLGPIDHLGGAVFGFVKGLLLVEVFLIVVSVFPAQTTVARAVHESRLAPVFLDRLPFVELVLPAEFRNPLQQLSQWQGLLGPSAVPPVLPGATPTAKPAPKP